MRLSDFEVNAIKDIFRQTFNSGVIYLFGSRVDDKQKGGDIDLYIITNDKDKIEKKINFLAKLKNKIGDQKIDIILSYDKNREIEKTALKGIILEKHNYQ